MDNAEIDVSGTNGGGTILVGGDYQGKNPDVQNSTITYFGPNAKLKADATDKGDGGKVIVWADDTTRAYGSISARGGANGGNGGFVETSGHRYLDVNGIRVMASAAKGTAGTWLLDPSDIEIYHDNSGGYGNSDGTTDNNYSWSGSAFEPTQCAGDSSVSHISDYLINTTLAGGTSVDIKTAGAGSGNGDIILTSRGGDVDIHNASSTPGLNLNLIADRNIVFDGSTGGTGTINFNNGSGYQVLNLNLIAGTGGISTKTSNTTVNFGTTGDPNSSVQVSVRNGKTWTNNGSVTFRASSYLELQNGARLINNHLVSLMDTTAMDLAAGTAGGRFDNFGTFLLASTAAGQIRSSHATELGVFNNENIVEIQAPTATIAARYDQGANGKLWLTDPSTGGADHARSVTLQNAGTIQGQIDMRHGNYGVDLYVTQVKGEAAEFKNLTITGTGGDLYVGGTSTSPNPMPEATFANVTASGTTLKYGWTNATSDYTGVIGIDGDSRFFDVVDTVGSGQLYIDGASLGLTNTAGFTIPTNLNLNGNVGILSAGSLTQTDGLSTEGSLTLVAGWNPSSGFCSPTVSTGSSADLTLTGGILTGGDFIAKAARDISVDDGNSQSEVLFNGHTIYPAYYAYGNLSISAGREVFSRDSLPVIGSGGDMTIAAGTQTGGGVHLPGDIYAGGSLSVSSQSAGGTIILGNNASSTLSAGTGLSLLSAGDVEIRGAASTLQGNAKIVAGWDGSESAPAATRPGSISLNGLTANAGAITLLAGSAIDATYNVIAAGNVFIKGASFGYHSGPTSFIRSDNGNIDITTTSGAIDLGYGSVSAANGSVTLDAATSINQSAEMGTASSITTGELTATAHGGDIYLEGENWVSSLQAEATGEINFATGLDLTVDKLIKGAQSAANISSSGNLGWTHAAGNLALDNSYTLYAGGDLMVTSSAGNLDYNGAQLWSGGGIVLAANGDLNVNSALYNQMGPVQPLGMGGGEVVLGAAPPSSTAGNGGIALIAGGALNVNAAVTSHGGGEFSLLGQSYTAGILMAGNSVNIGAGVHDMASTSPGVAIIAGGLTGSGPNSYVKSDKGSIVGLMSGYLSLDKGAYMEAGKEITLGFAGKSSTLSLNGGGYLLADSPHTINLAFASRSSGGIMIDGVETTKSTPNGSGMFVVNHATPAVEGAGLNISYAPANASTTPATLSATIDAINNAVKPPVVTNVPPSPALAGGGGDSSGNGNSIGGGDDEFGGKDKDGKGNSENGKDDKTFKKSVGRCNA
jgi:hypothetical protein